MVVIRIEGTVLNMLRAVQKHMNAKTFSEAIRRLIWEYYQKHDLDPWIRTHRRAREVRRK